MNKIKMLNRLAFLALALAAGASQACYIPPQGQLIAVDEQLGQATNVAVGQVISATPLGGRSVEYRFLVLEQLTGAPQKTFTLMGRAPVSGDKDTSFHDHQDFAFWAHGGGRTMNEGDCVIHPSFVVGDTYLVFLDAPPTWRSYEKLDLFGGIRNHEDKWLAYVKTWLAGTGPDQPDVPAYERVGRFLYGFHRIVTPEDRDIKALAAQHAPPELLYRASRLTGEFDRIVKNLAKVPDAQLDAMLREAGEVHAALAAWRAGAGH